MNPEHASAWLAAQQFTTHVHPMNPSRTGGLFLRSMLLPIGISARRPRSRHALWTVGVARLAVGLAVKGCVWGLCTRATYTQILGVCNTAMLDFVHARLHNGVVVVVAAHSSRERIAHRAASAAQIQWRR
jgi:hypothetical protein